MSSLNLTSNKDTYDVVVSCSPIYECALGIAAYTWPVMVDKLERTPEQWQSMLGELSMRTKREVNLAGQVHTWRSLLFLAHGCPDLWMNPLENHVVHFIEWVSQLGQVLPAQAAPYLGVQHEKQLAAAFAGDDQAKQSILRAFQDDPLVHPNLRYLFDTPLEQIEQHLRHLLIGWFEAIPQIEDVLQALAKDRDEKQSWVTSMSPAELVKRATNGIELQPEPMIRRIWFVPQVSYRPFTISNRIAQTSIYYYPIADERMPGQREWQSTLQVANLHKAVGDVHRVRILRWLHQSPRSVTGIGHLLDVAKSTAHHHLTLLRSVGLVQIENGVYILNVESVKQLGPRLAEYVGVKV